MTAVVCPKCNEPLDEGRLSVSDGTLGYVSAKQKGMLRQVTVIERARACPNCGYVELYVNPQTLQQRLG